MKILTWNLEWAEPNSKRGRIIAQKLRQARADVICLTEAFAEVLPSDGMVIEAAAGNAVADRKGAKKALLWSRWGWKDVSCEPQFAPPGRIVRGVADTPIGELTIFGVCIPWPDSNTPRLGGNRAPWEDHMNFVETLRERLLRPTRPTVVVGDFNQRMPRVRQPKKVADRLEDALRDFVVGTKGFVSSEGTHTIDHIACTPELRVRGIQELPRHEGSVRLSDHFGLLASIERA